MTIVRPCPATRSARKGGDAFPSADLAFNPVTAHLIISHLHFSKPGYPVLYLIFSGPHGTPFIGNQQVRSVCGIAHNCFRPLGTCILYMCMCERAAQRPLKERAKKVFGGTHD